MTKSRRLTTAFLLVAILLASCSSAEATPESMDVQNKINAAVAQTLSALTTKVAEVQKTDVPNPAETAQTAATATTALTVAPTKPAAQAAPVTTIATATATSKPVATVAAGDCTDYAIYIGDITIPDGTTVSPGTTFTKTWSVRNAGSCTWTPDYKLVWTGGDMKGPSDRVQLTTSNILPGQTAHISVDLIAPTTFIKFRSFWKLMNKNGQVFGIMDNKGEEKAVWAEIVVGDRYDFTANMCSATWSTSAGVIPCNGTKNDPRGFVFTQGAPAIEGGIKENETAIIMVPPDEPGGYIVAQYPPIIIMEGANLVLHFGCLEGYTKCNVRFRVTYSIEGGPEQELINQVHGFGEWERISMNLTWNNMYAMMNKPVSFLFYYYAMDGSSDNYAFLFQPIITP